MRLLSCVGCCDLIDRPEDDVFLLTLRLHLDTCMAIDVQGSFVDLHQT